MRPLSDLTADSLGAELRRAAAEVPDLPFLRMASGEWTYRQLDEHSDRVAAGLHAHGVCQGDRVTLMLPNSMVTTGLGEQQTAPTVESREAQACFADPDTAQRIAAFSQQRL